MKRAILILFQGTRNNTEVGSFQKRIEDLANQNAQNWGLAVKVHQFDFDDPPEVTYHLGRLVRFGAPNAARDGHIVEDMEEVYEEREQKLSDVLKAGMKEMAKSLWYGEKGPPKKEEEKKVEVSSSS